MTGIKGLRLVRSIDLRGSQMSRGRERMPGRGVGEGSCQGAK